MVTVQDFFKQKETGLAIYALTRDIVVSSYVWVSGETAYSRKKDISLPKGTKLVRNTYSNFGDGHSMQLFVGNENSTKIGRWFRVSYKDLELCKA